jgi:hypothetical protein
MTKFCRSCGEIKELGKFAKAGFNKKSGKQQMRATCRACHSALVNFKEKEAKRSKGKAYADCSNEECGHTWGYFYTHGKKSTVAKRTCPKCGSLPENLEELT